MFLLRSICNFVTVFCSCDVSSMTKTVSPIFSSRQFTHTHMRERLISSATGDSLFIETTIIQIKLQRPSFSFHFIFIRSLFSRISRCRTWSRLQQNNFGSFVLSFACDERVEISFLFFFHSIFLSSCSDFRSFVCFDAKQLRVKNYMSSVHVNSNELTISRFVV